MPKSAWKNLITSFRGKLALSFVILGLVAFVVVMILIKGFYGLDVQRSTQVKITSLHLSLVELIDHDKQFLNENYQEEAYYQTGESKYLLDRSSQIQYLIHVLDSLKNSDLFTRVEAIQINQVIELMIEYNHSFAKLSKKQWLRGFKDYGIEGKMRDYAHKLENEADLRLKGDILMLRRHEKDYFLRRDKIYVDKLNELIDALIKRMDSISTRSSSQNRRLLTQYQSAFNDIVTLEKEIGITSSDGLRQEMNYQSEWAKKSLNDALDSIEQQTANQRSSSIRLVFIALISGVLAGIFLTYYLSKSISTPFLVLTSKIKRFKMDSPTTIQASDFNRSELSQEVVVLLKAYNKMIEQIKTQVGQIEAQNHKLAANNDSLKQLNSELDRFAFSVSHDLRSPITSILGLINLVKIENPNLIEITYLNHIETCVEKLNKFIENLLFYSKNAQEEITVGRVWLKDIVQSFKSTHLTDRITNLDILITGEDTEIHTDEFRLDIILTNLLSNSVKYRDKTKPNSQINIYQSNSKNGTRITITDNGVGISKEDQKKVFDLFYRSSIDEDGTGLGLYLVRKSLEKIKGDIKLESKEGIGTEITLEIPKLKLNEPKPVEHRNPQFSFG